MHSKKIGLCKQRDSNEREWSCQENIGHGISAEGMRQVSHAVTQVQKEESRWSRNGQVSQRVAQMEKE